MKKLEFLFHRIIISHIDGERDCQSIQWIALQFPPVEKNYLCNYPNKTTGAEHSLAYLETSPLISKLAFSEVLPQYQEFSCY